jgi:capsular exopolysaccharide synthesis family protein
VSVPGQTNVEFADYGEILRRRWMLILLGIVVGVGLSAAALYVVPKTYTSVALIQVKSVGEDESVANGRTTGTLNLDTEAQLVTSNDVATRAKDLLRTNTSTRDLAKKVTVTVPPNTSVLSIGFDGSSPTAAQAGAQAFADAYLADRKNSAEVDLKAQAETIRAQITDLRSQLVQSNRRLASLPEKSAARADEEATNSSLVTQIRELNSELVPLVGKDINPGSIITDAQIPRYPSNLSTELLLGSGLLAGLLAGCLLALAVDRLDKRVRDRKDLERLGLDTMTGVVGVPAIRDAGSSLANGSGAVSLRQLRNALLAQMPNRAGTVIVANASDANAGSAVSVSLAVTIARSGTDVVLLSANTVHCAVDDAFDVSDQRGLASVLRGRTDLEDAVFAVKGIPHLTVVPAGADGSLSSDLLQGPKVESVIRRLGEMADVVVTDVAPTSFNADAQTLVTASDGVLIVATAMKTRRDEVLEAVDQFRHVSARVFGSVIVSVNHERRTSPRSKGIVRSVEPDQNPGETRDETPDKTPDKTPDNVTYHESAADLKQWSAVGAGRGGSH